RPLPGAHRESRTVEYGHVECDFSERNRQLPGVGGRPLTGKINFDCLIFGHVPDLRGAEIRMPTFVDPVLGPPPRIVRTLFGNHATLPIKYAFPLECESFEEVFEPLSFTAHWSRSLGLG